MYRLFILLTALGGSDVTVRVPDLHDTREACLSAGTEKVRQVTEQFEQLGNVEKPRISCRVVRNPKPTPDSDQKGDASDPDEQDWLGQGSVPESYRPRLALSPYFQRAQAQLQTPQGQGQGQGQGQTQRGPQGSPTPQSGQGSGSQGPAPGFPVPAPGAQGGGQGQGQSQLPNVIQQQSQAQRGGQFLRPRASTGQFIPDAVAQFLMQQGVQPDEQGTFPVDFGTARQIQQALGQGPSPNQSANRPGGAQQVLPPQQAQELINRAQQGGGQTAEQPFGR